MNSSIPVCSPAGAATVRLPREAPGAVPAPVPDAATTCAMSTELGWTESNKVAAATASAPNPSPAYGSELTEVIAAHAAAQRHEGILLTPGTVDALLTQMGMTSIGPDPDNADLTLWSQHGRVLYIRLPECVSGPDIARAIWHAGAREARREIRVAREDYLRTLAV